MEIPKADNNHPSKERMFSPVRAPVKWVIATFIYILVLLGIILSGDPSDLFSPLVTTMVVIISALIALIIHFPLLTSVIIMAVLVVVSFILLGILGGEGLLAIPLILLPITLIIFGPLFRGLFRIRNKFTRNVVFVLIFFAVLIIRLVSTYL